MLFSERIARKDMVSILDFLTRNFLTDLTPVVVIIQGDVDPGTFYTTSLGLAETIGNFIINLNVYQPKELSKSVFITTLDFIKEVYEDGKQPVAGVVKVVECETSASAATGSVSSGGSQCGPQKQYRLVHEGLAAFKNNVLVGYMDGIGARAYNFVTNKAKAAVVTVPTGEEFTVFQVRGVKTTDKLTLEGDQLTFDVMVQLVAGITAEGSTVDITKPDGIKTVQQGLNEMIAQEIAAAIRKAQTEFILADSSFLDLNKGAFYTGARYTEILIFLVFSFYLKEDSSINNTYFSVLAVFAFSFFLMLFPTVLTLGTDLARHMWNPYYVYTSQVEAFNFLERVQSINALAWFPMALLKLTMYSYMTSYAISGVVKAKSHKYFVFPLSMIAFIVCSLPILDNSNLILLLRTDQVFPLVILPVTFALPVVFLTVYCIRRKKIASTL